MQCLVVDFHFGQALGILRDLIAVHGLKDGGDLYLQLVAGCGTHLTKPISKAITQSAVSWVSSELPDVGLKMKEGGEAVAMDQPTWEKLAPDHRRGKMVSLAWSRVRKITGVDSKQEDVDHALQCLSLMSPTLKRLTDWLSQPVIKTLACPAYSAMDKHRRQLSAPKHDLYSDKFKITDNPAEGAHRRRQEIGKHEVLNEAIVTSYISDDTDWQRWEHVKRSTTSLHMRSTAGAKHQKEIKAQYAQTRREQIGADGAVRDGPSFDTKQCQTCASFVQSGATVCPECRTAMTKDGAASLSETTAARSSPIVVDTTSKASAIEALVNAQLSKEPERLYAVAEVHAVRGTKPNRSFHVQWSGFPFQAEWTWRPEKVLLDDKGQWICSHAMARFEHRLESSTL